MLSALTLVRSGCDLAGFGVDSFVAGERGRASNYFYGAAKAGFTAYLSGLRNRLHSADVRVVTVIPGFVRTSMTEGMSLPSLIRAQVEEVGTAIYRSAQLGGGEVIYVRQTWRPIMLIIKALPEFVFKRLRL